MRPLKLFAVLFLLPAALAAQQVQKPPLPNVAGPTTSAQLGSIITDETGSGPVVFATSPVLTTPNLGTPSAINLANATGLPSSSISGLLPAANFPALTGDVTTPGGSLATTLATVNGNVGSFGSTSAVPTFTVNGKGLVTAASTVSTSSLLVTATGSTTARSLAARAAEQYSVLDYGAACNGSADDATAINAATAAAGAAGGGKVVFPAGKTCKYGAAIDVPAQVVLVGAGIQSSVLSAAVQNINGVNLNGSFTGIQGLTIDCGAAGANSSGNCINFATNANEVYINDFRLVRPFTGIYMPTTVLNTIENGYIYYPTATTGHGIIINSTGNDQMLSNIYILGDAVNGQPRACMSVQATNGAHFYNINCLETGNGIIYEPGNGQLITWIWDEQGTYDSGSGHGILIQPTGTGIIRGLYSINTWTATMAGNGIFSNPGASATVDDVHFINHRSYNNTQHGALLALGTRYVFQGGSFCGNSAVIGSYDGIRITDVSNVLIQGVTIGACAGFTTAHQNYGIVMTNAGSDNVTITGNTLLGNVTGAYSLAFSQSATRVVNGNIGASDSGFFNTPVIATGLQLNGAAYIAGQSTSSAYTISANPTGSATAGGFISLSGSAAGNSVNIGTNSSAWLQFNSAGTATFNGPVDGPGGSFTLGNNLAYRVKDTGGTPRNVMWVGSDDFTNTSVAGGSAWRVLNQALNTSLFVVTNTATTTTIDSTGLGVGTTAPNARLSLGVPGMNALYVYDGGGAGAHGLGVSANTLNIFADATAGASATLAFGVWNKTTFTEWARITNGGTGINATPGSAVPGTNYLQVGGGMWSIHATNGSVGTYNTTAGHVGAYLFPANGYAGIATINNVGAWTSDIMQFNSLEWKVFTNSTQALRIDSQQALWISGMNVTRSSATGGAFNFINTNDSNRNWQVGPGSQDATTSFNIADTTAGVVRFSLAAGTGYATLSGGQLTIGGNLFLQGDGSHTYVRATTGRLYLGAGNANRVTLDTANFYSETDNAVTLGGSGNRWAGAYIQLPDTATTSAVCVNTSTWQLSYNGTAGTCTVSALAFKTRLNRLDDKAALPALAGLRTESWVYNKGTDLFDGQERVGLYADDVEKMDKRCAVYKDGKVYNYDDRCVLAYTVAALRELKAANDNLVKEVDRLKKAGARK